VTETPAPNVERFVEAQDQRPGGYASALAEIRSGGKHGHWIWYIFPQLAGLGQSPASVRYGIVDLPEARAYLQNETLRSRLLTITAAVAEQARGGYLLSAVMGSSIDAMKLVSSLTLFAHVARQLHAAEHSDAYRELATTAEEVLATAAAQGYPACRFTLDRLGADATPRR
jgi:uncharacterized protein (DUF1810 family)